MEVSLPQDENTNLINSSNKSKSIKFTLNEGKIVSKKLPTFEGKNYSDMLIEKEGIEDVYNDRKSNLTTSDVVYLSFDDLAQEEFIELDSFSTLIQNMDDTKTWDVQFSAINSLRSLNKYKPTLMEDMLDSLYGSLILTASSLKSAVSKNSLIFIRELIFKNQSLLIKRQDMFKGLIECLLKESFNVKSFINKEAKESFANLINLNDKISVLNILIDITNATNTKYDEILIPKIKEFISEIDPLLLINELNLEKFAVKMARNNEVYKLKSLSKKIYEILTLLAFKLSTLSLEELNSALANKHSINHNISNKISELIKTFENEVVEKHQCIDTSNKIIDSCKFSESILVLFSYINIDNKATEEFLAMLYSYQRVLLKDACDKLITKKKLSVVKQDLKSKVDDKVDKFQEI